MPFQLISTFVLGVIVGCNKDKILDTIAKIATPPHSHPFSFHPMNKDENSHSEDSLKK